MDTVVIVMFLSIPLLSLINFILLFFLKNNKSLLFNIYIINILISIFWIFNVIHTFLNNERIFNYIFIVVINFLLVLMLLFFILVNINMYFKKNELFFVKLLNIIFIFINIPLLYFIVFVTGMTGCC